MTDYQPLNSAEEVQRALDAGCELELFSHGRWSRYLGGDRAELIAKWIADGWKFRAPKPKDTPTPEAERDDWREQEIRNLSRSPEGDAAIAALSLPAAQDGDYLAAWLSVCRKALDDVATEMRATGRDDSRFIRLIESMPRPTPNAIRGDKGAEAVAWMRRSITYRGVDGHTDGERVISERKVYADDIPLFAAPTQAAAKDTP